MAIGQYRGVDIKEGTDADVSRQLAEIDSASLTPQSDFKLKETPPATQPDEMLGLIGSGADSFIKNLQSEAEFARKNTGNSFQDYIQSYLNTEGETALTDKAYRKTVDPAEAELKDINQQILNEQVALDRRIEAIEKRGGGLVSGQNIEIEQAKTESLRRQADLSIIQLAKQGKYDSAKAIADRAVSAQLEKDKLRNETLRFVYEENKDLFTTAEQRLFETQQAERERQYALKDFQLRADYEQKIRQNDPLYQAQLEKALAGDGGAPTIKTINGVDMQWNPAEQKWEPISGGVVGGGDVEKSLNQFNLLDDAISNAKSLSKKSGTGSAEKFIGDVIGGSEFRQLEAFSDTLRVNLLTLSSDPTVRKFFGPQMSNADVQLMLSAGSTLNPEKQSPAQYNQELGRIEDLVRRAKEAVQKGVSGEAPRGRVIIAPDGTEVQIVD